MAGRHRSYWLIRRRYRLGGYIGSLVSMLITAVYLVPMVHGADMGGIDASSGSVGGTIGLLLVAAVIPPVVARLLWRMHRRHYLDDMYPLSIV